jgi:O-antigen ligase
MEAHNSVAKFGLRSSNYKKYLLESLVVLVFFIASWIGLGSYASGLLLLAFIYSIFFREKRAFLFRDKTLVVLVSLFTLSCVVSSIFSIDRLISTLLSLVWFLVLLVPMSYTRFSLNEDSDFFIKIIVPVSAFLIFYIIFQLYFKFFYNFIEKGIVIQRYTSRFHGKASTPDVLVMLGGIGYGWLRQREGENFRWLGFLYLMAGFIGTVLTFDRGGVVAYFTLSVLLLSFDYKRLILFLVIIGVAVFLSFKIDELRCLTHFLEFLYNKRAQKDLYESTQLATFRAAWGMIKDHWLLGVGTNNFSKFTRQYGVKRWYAYAHNFVLQFWAENGLFGMIFGLSIIGVIIYRWLRCLKYYEYRYIALGVGASFIGILVGNLSNSTLWLLKIALPFWMLAGAISAMYFLINGKKGIFTG